MGNDMASTPYGTYAAPSEVRLTLRMAYRMENGFNGISRVKQNYFSSSTKGNECGPCTPAGRESLRKNRTAGVGLMRFTNLKTGDGLNSNQAAIHFDILSA